MVVRVAYWVAISEDENTFANDNDPSQIIHHPDEQSKAGKLREGEKLETTPEANMGMRFRTKEQCQDYCDTTRIKFKPVKCDYPKSMDTVRSNG